MPLPLQLTVNPSLGSSYFKGAYHYFYKQLGLPKPEVVKIENPLEFAQIFELLAADEEKALKKFKPLKGRGQRLDYRLWCYFNEAVARPLTAGAAAPQEIKPFMQKLKGQQLKVQQALQGHFKNYTSLKMEGLAAHHPHYFDQQWANYHYDSGRKNEDLNHLLQILHGGLLWAQHFKSKVFWCPLPIQMQLDENEQLHYEDGPALNWPGFNLYFWHGVQIPAGLINHPEKVTRQEVMQQRNAEVRRCYQEVLGAEKFAALFDLQAVDEEVDQSGHIQTLYRTAHVDDLAKSHLQFAKVICPTTLRVYFLCVPPNLNSIAEAVAWTFGKTPQDYHPNSET
jgi:hypothetical protein